MTDPDHWLEDATGERALDWVRAHNARTEQQIGRIRISQSSATACWRSSALTTAFLASSSEAGTTTTSVELGVGRHQHSAPGLHTGDKSALESFGFTHRFVFINVLEDVKNRIYVWSRKDRGWHREPLAGGRRGDGQLSVYGGFPRAVEGMRTVRAAFEQADADG